MWLIWSDEDAAEAWLRPELRPETKRRVGPDEPVPAFPLVSVAEDRGFEPLRAINPTRFPSERHRPLGESSAGRLPAPIGRGEIDLLDSAPTPRAAVTH